MIRVYKQTIAPPSLIKKKRYNEEDVVTRLIEDQQGKCYLCERKTGTDFQVEHLQSQKIRADLVFDWENLFLACSYCNGKKSESFSTPYSPAQNDVENEIISDFKDKRVRFSPTTDKEGIGQTTELLHRIFNGSNRIRVKREEIFFEYFLARINHFLVLVTDYRTEANARYKEAIIEELRIESEFLGIKYHLLKQSSLFNEFKEYMRWNRRIVE